MFGIFKKKTRKAITEVKKMENRDAVGGDRLGRVFHSIRRRHL